MIVAGQDRDVVLEAINLLDDDIHQGGVQIEVEIRQLHESKSVKLGRQLRQDHIVLHHVHIEEVPLADLVEASELERMPDERVHRDDSLKHEETLALVNFASPEAGLLANSS